eukprot:2838089-Alexandrium_andersonii.AAC.1
MLLACSAPVVAWGYTGIQAGAARTPEASRLSGSRSWMARGTRGAALRWASAGVLRPTSCHSPRRSGLELQDPRRGRWSGVLSRVQRSHDRGGA